MFLDDVIKVNIAGRNKRYYENLGYTCKVGEKISVKPDELMNQQTNVNVKCDCCGKEYKKTISDVKFFRDEIFGGYDFCNRCNFVFGICYGYCGISPETAKNRLNESGDELLIFVHFREDDEFVFMSNYNFGMYYKDIVDGKYSLYPPTQAEIDDFRENYEDITEDILSDTFKMSINDVF